MKGASIAAAVVGSTLAAAAAVLLWRRQHPSGGGGAPAGDGAGSGPGWYAGVIDSFDLARYARDEFGTHCNKFVFDVLLACQAPLPPELETANDLLGWFAASGAWQATSAEGAQAAANAGRPAVCGLPNPGGHGHISIVRPGTLDPRLGPATAQAGAQCFGNKPAAYGYKPAGEPMPDLIYFVEA